VDVGRLAHRLLLFEPLPLGWLDRALLLWWNLRLLLWREGALLL